MKNSMLRVRLDFRSSSVAQTRKKWARSTFSLAFVVNGSNYHDCFFHRFLRTVLPFEYSLESLIDDWILLGFLVGNDFLPHLPHLHINKGALTELYDIYKKELPTLGGELNLLAFNSSEVLGLLKV